MQVMKIRFLLQINLFLQSTQTTTQQYEVSNNPEAIYGDTKAEKSDVQVCPQITIQSLGTSHSKSSFPSVISLHNGFPFLSMISGKCHLCSLTKSH